LRLPIQKVSAERNQRESPKKKMFSGKYERVSSENLEEFLTLIKVPEAWKKMSMTAKTTMEVTTGTLG
jgi:hypothetical protein